MIPYGPFVHWILGPCLGVNIIGFRRECVLNCIYCPYVLSKGKCTRLNSSIEGLIKTYEKYSNVVDVVFIGGYGDSLLNPSLTNVLSSIRSAIGVKIALMTTYLSVTMMCIPRDILDLVDFMIIKFDAVSEEAVEFINRPSANVRIDDTIRSVKALSEVSNVILEVNLLRGSSRFLNTESIELRKLIEAIIDISPQRVGLQSFPGFSDVGTLSINELIEVARVISDYISWRRISIRGLPLPSLHIDEEVEESLNRVLNVIRNFPLNRNEVMAMCYPRRVAEEVIARILNRDDIAFSHDYFMLVKI